MSSMLGGLAVLLGGEREQQPERVAVGGDRVRAGVALADQPVGEERLQRRCEQAHRAPLLGAFEALGGEREQLRSGLQIPVGRSRVDVPEVGAQQRQPRLDVLAIAGVAVGVEQRVDRERVA